MEKHGSEGINTMSVKSQVIQFYQHIRRLLAEDGGKKKNNFCRYTFVIHIS